MPTAAHQAAHEDPRIAPQPCGPTQRLAAVGIGDDAGARLAEVEHDEFAPVVGLQKGAQARCVVAGRIHPRAESREAGLELMRPQRARKSVNSERSVSVRVDVGGSMIMKKKN